jgi:hypothetical protein
MRTLCLFPLRPQRQVSFYCVGLLAVDTHIHPGCRNRTSTMLRLRASAIAYIVSVCSSSARPPPSRSGRWNIYRIDVSTKKVEHVFSVETEVGGPAWTLGNSHYGILESGEVVCAFRPPGEADDRLCILDTSRAASLPITWESSSASDPALTLIHSTVLPSRYCCLRLNGVQYFPVTSFPIPLSIQYFGSQWLGKFSRRDGWLCSLAECHFFRFPQREAGGIGAASGPLLHSSR